MWVLHDIDIAWGIYSMILMSAYLCNMLSISMC